MDETYKLLWNKCLEIIRDNIGQEKFDAWFSCSKPISYADDTLTLELPTLYVQELYETRFHEILSKSLRRVFGDTIKWKYDVPVISGDRQSHVHMSASRQSSIALNKTVTSAQGAASPFAQSRLSDIDSQLNPVYNFENYCVGESNHLPFVIAEFIAQNPRKNDFNPFFLYGDVGVGKTHLIQAVGLRLKENNPQMRVLYVSSRMFQNQYSTAKIKGNIPDFITWYEGIDVLLIDDLQEISYKAGTLNALFPIFNHLHQRGKKLMFTCDRPPVELDGMTDRLIDRFKWGVVEQLPKPDLALRKAILNFKAERNGLSIPPEVIDIIAEKADGSVRQLEGIVMGILTNSIARNQPITVEMALEVMRHSIRHEKRVINFDMIVEATAEYYKLSPDVIFTKSRLRDIADARQLIMYLAGKHTKLSSSAIGGKLNRRHATVLYGIKTIKDRIPYSRELAEAIDSIEASLKKM